MFGRPIWRASRCLKMHVRDRRLWALAYYYVALEIALLLKLQASFGLQQNSMFLWQRDSVSEYIRRTMEDVVEPCQLTKSHSQTEIKRWPTISACQRFTFRSMEVHQNIVQHCFPLRFPVTANDHIMCAAWISHRLHSFPVSCCRICLSRTSIGSPNRLLIDYNCLCVSA